MFFLLKIISTLPLRLLYLIAHWLSYPLERVYRRNLVKKNLKRAFTHLSDEELRVIIKQFYRNFCTMVVEVLKATTMKEEELAKRITFINPEIIYEQHRKSRPVLFYASHQCNWEWMALACNANLTGPPDLIYKPLQNKKADRFIHRLRARFGAQLVPKDKAARRILKRKGTHRVIGLVADQSPPREHVHWAHFLGMETDFYPGLIQLPYLMQATAVFGRMVRKRRGYYEVEIVQIGEPPYPKKDYSVLENYVRETERLIKKYPEDYLWTHNRWKHTRQEHEELIRFSAPSRSR